MPLFILGLVFVIGLFIYFLVATRSTTITTKEEVKKDKEEGNVIFLPTDIEKAKRDFKKH